MLQLVLCLLDICSCCVSLILTFVIMVCIYGMRLILLICMRSAVPIDLDFDVGLYRYAACFVVSCGLVC